jgi:hypothetical protein
MDSEEELEVELLMDFPMSTVVRLLSTNPALVAALEVTLRAQNLKSARRVGNTSGKWAQRPLPRGVNRSTNPQRIF